MLKILGNLKFTNFVVSGSQRTSYKAEGINRVSFIFEKIGELIGSIENTNNVKEYIIHKIYKNQVTFAYNEEEYYKYIDKTIYEGEIVSIRVGSIEIGTFEILEYEFY